MPTFSFTVSDAQANRVVDAFCDLGNWTEADGPRSQFVREMVKDYMKSVVISYEKRQKDAQALAAVSYDPPPDVT